MRLAHEIRGFCDFLILGLHDRTLTIQELACAVEQLRAVGDEVEELEAREKSRRRRAAKRAEGWPDNVVPFAERPRRRIGGSPEGRPPAGRAPGGRASGDSGGGSDSGDAA